MKNLFELLFYVGVRIRNPLIFEKLDFLLLSQFFNIQEIQKLQTELCHKLLIRAYNNSEFYKKKFDEAGFNPDKFQSLNDLSKIPIINKIELLQNANSIQNFVSNEKHFLSETSGSTGNPLIFYRNASWDAWHRASVFRGYHWHNVKPWEKNGYLWGFNFSFRKKIKVRLLDKLQNRFRLFTYEDREIARFVKYLENCNFLAGYSSMIYEIAKFINRMDSPPTFKLNMVKGTSEKIFESYQTEVSKAFGKEMISEYGSAEGGIISFECASGTQHINMETVYVEVIDNEIVVTNLVSESFPIIRYKLGDFVVLDENNNCECGVQHIALKEVLGRVGKIIYGVSHNYPSLTLYYIFKNLALNNKLSLNYQAKQQVKGLLEVLIEQRLNLSQLALLNDELTKYFGNDMQWTITDSANLKSKKSKKIDFISTLTI